MWKKWSLLKEKIEAYDGIAVAFSGGVDSTLLLYAAKEVCKDKVIALTATPSWVSEREKQDARVFCEENGISHITFGVEADSIEGFSKNPKNRCYLCKKKLFENMLVLANKEGIQVVAEGSNMDDLSDYRPGLVAIEELGIKSPLREAGLTKAEIRALLKEFNLPVWDKPAFACLASRFVYGEEITDEKLSMVERAEDFLHQKGFGQYRVRIHDKMARVEVPKEDFQRFLTEDFSEEFYSYMKELGFSYVTMDLGGYRMGSMNEINGKRL